MDRKLLLLVFLALVTIGTITVLAIYFTTINILLSQNKEIDSDSKVLLATETNVESSTKPQISNTSVKGSTEGYVSEDAGKFGIIKNEKITESEPQIATTTEDIRVTPSDTTSYSQKGKFQ